MWRRSDSRYVPAGDAKSALKFANSNSQTAQTTSARADADRSASLIRMLDPLSVGVTTRHFSLPPPRKSARHLALLSGGDDRLPLALPPSGSNKLPRPVVGDIRTR